MGNNKSKESDEKPTMATKAKKQEQTKHVRLLVLHKNAQKPQPGTDKFCDALNTNHPPGTLNVDEVKISEIPDDGQSPESDKTWVSEWLSRGRIVLVCLLSDYDINANFGNDNKIIVFCFRNPPVNVPCICIDVDFYTATPGSIKEKSDELADTIRAGGR